MVTATTSVRDVVDRVVPGGATVLVVSRGDDTLLDLDGRRGWHFPRDATGVYAGHYPGDSRGAIEHLEVQRAKGAQYLLFPASAFWWLDHYVGFREHLDSRYLRVRADARCIVYSLTDGPATDSGPHRRNTGGADRAYQGPTGITMTFNVSGTSVDLPDSVLVGAEQAASEMMDLGELLHLAATLARCRWRPGAIVVEIGTFHGRTAVFMAKTLEAIGVRAPVLCIDPFDRVQPTPFNPQGNYQAFLETVRAAGLEDTCLPLAAFAEHAAGVVPDSAGVLVVDGNHDYPAVRQDLELYGPKVIPGGLMFVDDYGPAYPGVMRAVDEYFAPGSAFTLLHKSYFVVAERRLDGHMGGPEMGPSEKNGKPAAGPQVITLDYPVNPEPRYGYGKEPHRHIYEILNRGRSAYSNTLAGFLEYKSWFAEVPVEADPQRPAEPSWVNGYFPTLDGISLYGFLARGRPGIYLEIGSGNSTKFAAKAIRDQRLPTRITSIDPSPRVEVEALCSRSIRSPLEDADLEEFSALGEGDVLLFDGSHRCFTNSDVTVFFLDVLPRLKPGVLVAIHDIFLPYDYPPPAYNPLYYSEQYLLAVALLAEGRRMDVVLPNAFVYADAQLSSVLAPLYAEGALSGVHRNGCLFWFRTR